ncbi:aldo/keto reductase [Paenibacillus hemerocallicola]|uniref:Aldo/keto reductase n=1 Tax=Paenibacillus hemerocallicola TaxID=1172614 RepID=A0A5C4SZT1_9BACL|nr:aldo/keto reductase [Paenibacillus hemerocallicola]TNJ60827.1 aldo/keto reductase [Paenibacillus hemerocallicola]
MEYKKVQVDGCLCGDGTGCELCLPRPIAVSGCRWQSRDPGRGVDYEEILITLNDLVKEGKIHHIGTSNHLGWQIVQAQAISDRFHIQRFVSEQTPYTIINRRMEFELAEIAKHYDLVYSPLSGGLLTGTYTAGQAAQSDSRAATLLGYVDTLDPELANAKGPSGNRTVFLICAPTVAFMNGEPRIIIKRSGNNRKSWELKSEEGRGHEILQKKS